MKTTILLCIFFLISCSQPQVTPNIQAFSETYIEDPIIYDPVPVLALCSVAQVGVQLSDQELIGRVQVVDCSIDPSDGRDGWLTLNPVKLNWSLVVILDAVMMEKRIEIQFDNAQNDIEGYNYTQAVYVVNEEVIQ